MKLCLECSKNFKPHNAKSKFCSCLCAGKYNQNCKKVKSWTKVDKFKLEKIKIKKCQQCNREFERKAKLCIDCQLQKNKTREKQRAKSRIQEKMQNARLIKEQIVNQLGGCKHCGYKKCMRALSFHHIDPKTKNFTLDTSNIMKKKLSDVLSEVKKCLLLCQNCHAELHQSNRDITILNRMNSQDKFKLKIRNRKMSLILYKGSKCQNCHYNFNLQNLQCANFHHLHDKKFEINTTQIPKYTDEELYIEVDKCLLLCSNCHMEYHDSITRGSPSTK